MGTLEVFRIFLKLGFTSFGGPIAHLAYFHDEFVTKQRWLKDRAYADLVALCQFLPGPASSQVGMALGFSRSGYLGAVAAWLGFTLPSAIALVLFGLGISQFDWLRETGALHGLKIAAVAVVAQALWGMAPRLCPDWPRVTMAFGAALISIAMPSVIGQVAAISSAGLIGWWFLRTPHSLPHEPLHARQSQMAALVFLSVFFLLLLLLPVFASISGNHAVTSFDSFFRAGSLVFGGGHVVLPMLQAETVTTGWVSPDAFMAGYGAAQAIPGPLLAFCAYLGAVSQIQPAGWAGAAICLVAGFLPSFLLILGSLVFWERLRTLRGIHSAMLGVNAAVVGLLLAAFYNPVWTSAIHSPLDFSVAAIGFLALAFWNVPSWAIVLASALVGWFWY